MKLFFALWPDDSVREQLAAASAGLPAGIGRPVPADNYHMTLLFIGNAGPDVHRCLKMAAARLESPRFTLTLQQFGYWPGPGVVWLAPVQPPAALFGLAQQLRQSGVDCGVADERRAYRPHVTILRKVGSEPDLPALPDLVWPVHDFVLCQSVTIPAGVRYEVLKRWPLTAA